MKRNLVDIIFLILLSLFIGIGRALIIQDISIIKVPPKIAEKLPERLSEPMLINLELSKQLFNQSAIFIDARDSIPFSEGHIEGSINIPWDNSSDEQINEKLKDLKYDDILVIYCSGGDCTLSIDLAEYIFNELSFEQVFIFDGGYPLWLEDNLPIKRFCESSTQLEKDKDCIYVE